MLAFRYDVLLEVGAVAPAPTLQWHDWQRAGFDLPTLDARLRQGHEPFGIVGIPNARVQRAVRLNAALANACDSEPAHALRAGLQRGDEIAIDPESLAATCEAAQWQAELLPSPERADEFAVVVHRGSLTAFEADAALLARCPCARGRMASNPLLATIGPGLERDLRSYLAERLPSPMIPARIEPLAKFPLLANGKVDRAALALLAEPRARPVPGALAKAADALESLLAEIWAGVLRLKRVGAEDHFFNDLGGHSLLATQVVSRVREALQIELPLRLLFEHCTVRSFAAALIALPQGGSNLVEIAQLVREIGSLDAAALDEQLGVQGGCG